MLSFYFYLGFDHRIILRHWKLQLPRADLYQYSDECESLFEHCTNIVYRLP